MKSQHGFNGFVTLSRRARAFFFVRLSLNKMKPDDLVLVPTAWDKRRPIVLQPHQKRIQKLLPRMQFPFYLYWGMGSGKTIGGCVCMQKLGDGDRALVLCDKSTVEQWRHEVQRMFGCNTAEYARIAACVQHYEYMDDANGKQPRHFQMVIVDEAHRFRNAWDRASTRMLSWMARIHECPQVVFLSGTPIVHDAIVEEAALRRMMRTDDLTDRISHYDPRTDPKKKHHYARVEHEVVSCPMSWSQTFLYLQNRRQTFALPLESGTRERVSSSRNTYNTALRSICNCPFDDVAESSKMREIVQRLAANEEAKQVVYSSRKDTGVVALMRLWGRPKTTFRVDGSMSKLERAEQIAAFQRHRSGVLFITDAGAQGIDLKRVHVVHIVEPADNEQEERQVINRAVRFKAHREKNATVRVLRYVAIFPVSGKVDQRWHDVVKASGLFTRGEFSGKTRETQYALMRMMNEEEDMTTIDEKTLVRRALVDDAVQACLATVCACDVFRNQNKVATACEQDDDDANNHLGGSDPPLCE